jgi:hypothetical protein
MHLRQPQAAFFLPENVVGWSGNTLQEQMSKKKQREAEVKSRAKAEGSYMDPS